MAVVRFQVVAISAAFALCTAMNPALAQKSYDNGVSDTEIKIGNILPYSGPNSAYAVIGKTRRLFRQGQCRGRHQRPQDQVHLV